MTTCVLKTVTVKGVPPNWSVFCDYMCDRNCYCKNSSSELVFVTTCVLETVTVKGLPRNGQSFMTTCVLETVTIKGLPPNW